MPSSPPHTRESSTPSSSSKPSPSNSIDQAETSRATPSSSSPPLPSKDDQATDIDSQSFSSSKLFSSVYNNQSSSSSGGNNNPLLPSIPTNTASILASKYDPSLSYFQSSSSSSSDTAHDDHHVKAVEKEIPRIPEKCFSFCTQSDGVRPMCRMFCLRKRPPIMTREQQLKRLRPPSITRSTETTPVGIKINDNEISWYKRPFESLRNTVTPYSFIYVKGTPDGVIGRYMEELEWDDGEYDFGNLSRSVINGSADVKGKKRKEERSEGWVWLDWGEHGSLFHLPFTTIFYPILSIPNTLSNLLTPSYNLLKLYGTSFTDGGQLRSLEKFNEELKRGGAIDILNKLSGYWEKRVQETREKREEMMKQLKDERSREVEGGKGE
uniref:Uncharacterized protein n=1 Tax=Kwoniella pini CBS 10737 TaxID=1296096 RepID=A0A1B9HS57_9TREE|nr:uncharacterized protein I206_07898 [Kwoniella pini CBS 10737]OCF46113.1 hypothetical protein I206_07898 [Kwoniella pini CBS 10737]